MIGTKQLVSLLISGAFSAVVQTWITSPAEPDTPDTAPEVDRRPAAATVPAAKKSGRTCLGASNRTQVLLDLEVSDDDYGVAYDSPALWVKRGSPCNDINVRGPVNASGMAVGQPVCTLVKVILHGRDIVGWVQVCGGWEELARWVPEGEPFVLRAAIRPVEITVAT